MATLSSVTVLMSESGEADVPPVESLGVAYSEAGDALLDVHLPQGEGPFPAVLLVRAEASESQRVSPVLWELREEGWATVVVDVASSEVPADVLYDAAVRWVVENGEQQNLDVGAVVVAAEGDDARFAADLATANRLLPVSGVLLVNADAVNFGTPDVSASTPLFYFLGLRNSSDEYLADLEEVFTSRHSDRSDGVLVDERGENEIQLTLFLLSAKVRNL